METQTSVSRGKHLLLYNSKYPGKQSSSSKVEVVPYLFVVSLIYSNFLFSLYAFICW